MELLDKLEIPYKNKELYETALTHTSYANENHVKSYERLEYLGDAVYINKPTRSERYILVEALNTYKELNLKDSDLNYIPKEKER